MVSRDDQNSQREKKHRKIETGRLCERKRVREKERNNMVQARRRGTAFTGKKERVKNEKIIKI